jgi:hypothetical protein
MFNYMVTLRDIKLSIMYLSFTLDILKYFIQYLLNKRVKKNHKYLTKPIATTYFINDIAVYF